MFLYEEAIGSLRWTSVICTTVVCCQCSVFFHAKATASSFQWQWVEQGNYSIWAFPIASKKRKSAPIWNRRYKIFRNSVVKVFKSDSFFFFFQKMIYSGCRSQTNEILIIVHLISMIIVLRYQSLSGFFISQNGEALCSASGEEDRELA